MFLGVFFYARNERINLFILLFMFSLNANPKKIQNCIFDQHATIDSINNMEGVTNEGDLEVGGTKKKWKHVLNALVHWL